MRHLPVVTLIDALAVLLCKWPFLACQESMATMCLTHVETPERCCLQRIVAEDVVEGIRLVAPVECTIIVQPGTPDELELSGEDFHVVRERF